MRRQTRRQFLKTVTWYGPEYTLIVWTYVAFFLKV